MRNHPKDPESETIDTTASSESSNENDNEIMDIDSFAELVLDYTKAEADEVAGGWKNVDFAVHKERWLGKEDSFEEMKAEVKATGLKMKPGHGLSVRIGKI